MTTTAIVTGGASGIGLALADALVRRGTHVVVADIDGDAAERAAGDLRQAAAGSAVPAQVDVADADAVSDLVESTYARQGRLDLLFNNAGIGAAVPVEHVDLDHWERTIDVNLLGVIHGCHAAYPLMVRQGSGRIVNTASLAGLVGGLGAAVPYATTKHGVVGYTLAMRVAAAQHGVRFHVVCPGGIDTPLLDKTQFAGLPVPHEAPITSMRAYSSAMGVRRFYPADRFAEDVLRGLARNRALIVGPSSARISWRLWRLAPELMIKLSIVATRWQERRGGLPQ